MVDYFIYIKRGAVRIVGTAPYHFNLFHRLSKHRVPLATLSVQKTPAKIEELRLKNSHPVKTPKDQQ